MGRAGLLPPAAMHQLDHVVVQALDRPRQHLRPSQPSCIRPALGLQPWRPDCDVGSGHRLPHQALPGSFQLIRQMTVDDGGGPAAGHHMQDGEVAGLPVEGQGGFGQLCQHILPVIKALRQRLRPARIRRHLPQTGADPVSFPA